MGLILQVAFPQVDVKEFLERLVQMNGFYLVFGPEKVNEVLGALLFPRKHDFSEFLDEKHEFFKVK